MEESTTVIELFDILIKRLLVLSFTANDQKEIVGYGEVAYEIAEEFHTFYEMTKKQFVNENLLNSSQCKELDNLYQTLDKFLQDGDSSFWNDALLDTHADWQKVRELAGHALKSLKKAHLALKVVRSVENVVSENGKPLVIERTKLELIEGTSPGLQKNC